MTELEKLDICQTCSNRKFDRNAGLLCGLTSAKPVFEDSCPDFIPDPKQQKSAPTGKLKKGAGLRIAIGVVFILWGVLKSLWVLANFSTVSFDGLIFFFLESFLIITGASQLKQNKLIKAHQRKA